MGTGHPLSTPQEANGLPDAAAATAAVSGVSGAASGAAKTVADADDSGGPPAAAHDASVPKRSGAEETANGQPGGNGPRLQRTLLLQPIADKASRDAMTGNVELHAQPN